MAITSTVLVRTTADPASLLRPMLQAVRDLDDALPVITAKTMTQHVSDSLGPLRRGIGSLLGPLSALGLGLASLGLYVVVSFAVLRRSREIGIRMTLGARPPRVIWVLSKSVAKLLGVGVTLGLALSWLVVLGLGALHSSLDQQESVGLASAPAADPMTFALVMLVMAAVGLAATFFPAWRATRANPLVALRDL